MQQKGLGRCGEVEGLELGKLFYIIRIGPKCNHRIFIGGSRRIGGQGSWRYHNGSEDWSEETRSRGLQEASGSWNKQTDLFLESA